MITARITGEAAVLARLRASAAAMEKEAGRTVRRLDQELQRRLATGRIAAGRRQRMRLPASGSDGRGDLSHRRERFRAPLSAARRGASSTGTMLAEPGRSPLRAALTDMRPAIAAAVAEALATGLKR